MNFCLYLKKFMSLTGPPNCRDILKLNETCNLGLLISSFGYDFKCFKIDFNRDFISLLSV